MKQTWIADLEVYPNFFFWGVKDFKGQTIKTYEISERMDQRDELYEDMMLFDGYLVTFNGLHYDEVLIKKLIKDYDKLISMEVPDFLRTMKKFSDMVIQSEDVPSYFDEIKWYKWYNKVSWTSIDLFCYWSKMLRISKKLSLKSLAIQLNHDEIQELPYHHTQVLTPSEMDEIIRYNTRNDLGVTEKLFNKMKEDILLRAYIEEEYELPAWSYDAPKVAAELLIQDYCKQTFDHDEHEDLNSYLRDFKSQRYNPYTGLIKDIMGDFEVDFELPIFQEFKNRAYNSDRTYSDEFNLIHEASGTRVKMSYGVGGAHAQNSDEYYKEDDEWEIVTSDYASLYPNIIINWKCIRFIETLMKYISVKSERLEAKRNGEKTKDKLFKLILNSIGLLH